MGGTHDIVKSLQIGDWELYFHGTGGVEFLNPRGRALFIAPFAPEEEKRAVLQALPGKVREAYHSG